MIYLGKQAPTKENHHPSQKNCFADSQYSSKAKPSGGET